MSFLFRDGLRVRQLFLAALIALVIQLPFLALMNVAGIHSVLGAVWVSFYFPAILLIDTIGLPTPTMSRLIRISEVVVVQEIILLIIILPFIAIYVRFKSKKKAKEPREERRSDSKTGWWPAPRA